ncbi:hypothetical protein [Microvirga thermotolerans]|uniref:Uncharacterized protein n=1 Tax=Microvirga thermotolerans TaxID=2651334 RepID=A0A5P9JVP3_9HYPH|nr:hypothetical protein [Microvirga thermotolerans]QFU16269.1 hypothetical protein GDR74_08555 [Microvirga thermotolerans]
MKIAISELHPDDLERVSGGMMRIPLDVYLSLYGGVSYGGSGGNTSTGIGAGGLKNAPVSSTPPRQNPVVSRYARMPRGGMSAWDYVTSPDSWSFRP